MGYSSIVVRVSYLVPGTWYVTEAENRTYGNAPQRSALFVCVPAHELPLPQRDGASKVYRGRVWARASASSRTIPVQSC